MEGLEEFTLRFTDHAPEHVLRRATYFAPSRPPSDDGLTYTGIRLGERRRKAFVPSLALLDWINERTERWVSVNDKSAWLFLCGKNILKEGILARNAEEGLVIVRNARGECLGYGKITGAGVTNLLDKGDFLRRES